jgi:hypothetical protein
MPPDLLPTQHTELYTHNCRQERARSSMDRAPDYGSGGWGFKSLRAHHNTRTQEMQASWQTSVGRRLFQRRGDTMDWRQEVTR